MRRNVHLFMVTGIFLCALAACASVGVQGPKIELKRYAPAFTADLSEYKGKPIYLMNFDNQANDTTVFNYFSPDKKFSYVGDSTIHNYFWYAFEKALKNIGMIVSNMDKPDPGAPAMWITLKSVTDMVFTVEVKIQKLDSLSFTKVYAINEAALSPGERTPENLEKRAYKMTNKLLDTVLTDPEFKAAFFKVAEEMSSIPVK
jgi:hypothetical protein